MADLYSSPRAKQLKEDSVSLGENYGESELVLQDPKGLQKQDETHTM